MRLFTRLVLFLAFGVCAIGQAQPTLAISVSHNGTFVEGQTNAFFLIRVSNVGTGPTTAALQVTDHLVNGLTITSLSGVGWSCNTVTCWRSDVLAAGQTFPAIVAQGSISHNSPDTITYGATVYFGGDPVTHFAQDTANVVRYGYPVAWGGNVSGEALAPTGLNNVVALSGGGSNSLALKGDGTVVGWGDNTYGQTTVPSGLSGVLAISAGDMHSLALKNDGSVVAWGDNSAGEATIPTGLGHVVAVATGHAHSVALKSDGTVAVWGDNTYGQLNVPTGLKNVVAITAGWGHNVALKSDGTLVAWGYNVDHECTIPTTAVHVTAIAAGAYHTVALKKDGSVVAWGGNRYGQATAPNLDDVVQVAAGWDHSLALKEDGSIVGWGYNGYSQLQIPAGSSTPVYNSIAAGGYHSLGLMSTPLGTIPIVVQASATSTALGLPGVIVDGMNYSGAGVLFNWVAGANHIIAASLPAPSGGIQYVFGSWSDGGAISHSVTPTVGTIYTAHFTTQYQLTTATSGNGTVNPAAGNYWYNAGAVATVTASAGSGSAFTGWSGGCIGTGACKILMSAPASVTAGFSTVSLTTPNLSLTVSHNGRFLQNQSTAMYVLRVSNGPTGASTGSTTITVTDTLPTGMTLVSMSGLGWTCATNSCNRSDALTGGQSYPAIVVIVQVASTAGTSLTNVGKLFVGASTTASQTVSDVTAVAPTGYPLAWGSNANLQSALTSSTTNVVAIGGGAAHTVALKADGTVQAWGDNSHHQTTVPTGLTGVAAIAVGSYHTLALKTNGTVVAWGDNTYGQSTVPSILANVVAIAAGAYHSLAVKSDGTVVGWGYNTDGETTAPITLTNAVAVAAGNMHSLALASDGSVVGWGSDAMGQLYPPGGLVGVVAIAAGANHNLALDATGAVKAWGDNTHGQSSVPSGLTGIAAVAAGGDHSLAMKKTGTVVAWGDNTYSENAVSGGLTTAAAIGAGTNHSLAVNTGSAGGIVITLTAPQAGTSYSVDSNAVTANTILMWASGSSHTLSAATPQAGPAGTQSVFTSWSDSGAATHSVAPTAATTYKVTFKTQYLFTPAAVPPTEGKITPATPTWLDSGAVVTVTEKANLGYKFANWSGACTGTAACKVTMNAPAAVTANFVALPPSLSIVSKHIGSFYRGEPLAYYTLTISNAPSAGPSVGRVSVTDFLGAGLGIVSISGSGWNCTLTSATCSRTDVLGPALSYPNISVGVYVMTNAPLSTSNKVTVGGGGAPSRTYTDPTTVLATAP